MRNHAEGSHIPPPRIAIPIVIVKYSTFPVCVANPGGISIAVVEVDTLVNIYVEIRKSGQARDVYAVSNCVERQYL